MNNNASPTCFMLVLSWLALLPFVIGASLAIGSLDPIGGLVTFSSLSFLQAMIIQRSHKPAALIGTAFACASTTAVIGALFVFLRLESARRSGGNLMFNPAAGALIAGVLSLLYCTVSTAAIAAIYSLVQYSRQARERARVAQDD